MNLKEARQRFVEVTGRYDLIVDTVDWKDDGADYFINQGVRFLDRELALPGQAIADAVLETGQWILPVPNLRALYHVSRIENGKVIYLHGTSYDGLRCKYPYAEPFTTMNNAVPTHWALTDTRRLTITKAITHSSKSVIILPPTNATINLVLEGLFLSPPLINDEDINWWLEFEEGLVIDAASYSLEVYFRNRQGQLDKLIDLREDLAKIDKDNVEQTIHKLDRMITAW